MFKMEPLQPQKNELASPPKDASGLARDIHLTFVPVAAPYRGIWLWLSTGLKRTSGVQLNLI